jgi:poly(3-hydroxybutyrate) depolymerase
MLRRSNRTGRISQPMMLYQWHELGRHLMAPWIHQAGANAKLFADPHSWLSTLPGADRLAAATS